MFIRKEQMEILSKASMEKFVKNMVKHLRTNFPKQLEKQGISEKDLESMVWSGMSSAKSYGITSEIGIEQYLECMVILCPDFDINQNYAWAGEILRNKNLTPNEKTEALNLQILLQEDWEVLENV